MAFGAVEGVEPAGVGCAAASEYGDEWAEYAGGDQFAGGVAGIAGDFDARGAQAAAGDEADDCDDPTCEINSGPDGADDPDLRNQIRSGD